MIFQSGRRFTNIFGTGEPLKIWETVKRTDKAVGFVPLPQRWVVERTFGWFNWSRRLSKDYEILTDTSEAFLYIAMIRLSLRRLA